jgi:hypothetical protein
MDKIPSLILKPVVYIVNVLEEEKSFIESFDLVR